MTASLFGFAGTEYFAIPDNPDLRALATTIDDRLFKIRNSQDINGVTRILPTFDPPIDPALLVQAAAQGLSLSSVVAGLNATVANCGFARLLQGATELTSQTMSLGQLLLSVREKKDAETLAAMQSRHELALNSVAMDAKKMALDDANQSLAQIQYSRLASVNRFMYYKTLIGGDLSGIPTLDNEFQALDAHVEAPVSGGLSLSPLEQEAMDRASDAMLGTYGVAAYQMMSSVFHALPNTNEAGTPLGVGVDFL